MCALTGHALSTSIFIHYLGMSDYLRFAIYRGEHGLHCFWVLFKVHGCLCYCNLQLSFFLTCKRLHIGLLLPLEMSESQDVKVVHPGHHWREGKTNGDKTHDETRHVTRKTFQTLSILFFSHLFFSLCFVTYAKTRRATRKTLQTLSIQFFRFCFFSMFCDSL